MGNEFEVYRDADGNNHLIFDQSALYDDSQIGDKMSDFEVLRILGAFNNKNPISKVRCLKNNKIYALKKIDLKLIQNKEEKDLCLMQMEKLKSLNHPHLLKYYKTFQDENQVLYLIYEYMNNSDLNSLIRAHSILDKKVKEETIWNILLQCLSGVSYLHQQKLSAYAIKPVNIYLNNEQNTKICLFYDLPKLDDKNYDIQNDIKFIGKYFYKMCFLEKGNDKNEWIDDIQVKYKNTGDYSQELLNIIYMMLGIDGQMQKSSTELYKIAQEEYVKKFTKVTSIEAVLQCLYSFNQFNQAINNEEKSKYIEENKEKCYISYWFLQSIKAIQAVQANNFNYSYINTKNILKSCYEEFRRALASANSKIDCSKEVDPIFLFAFLLEKMHKELNKKNMSFVNYQNTSEQYVINSIYRMEEKDDKTNKTEMWNKFNSYMSENINSEISKFFYGIKKLKRLCQQCRNGFYVYSNFFCSAVDLTKSDNNNGISIEKIIDRIKNSTKSVCEVCLTEQSFLEFDDYYEIPNHLVICFYRGVMFNSDAFVPINSEIVSLKEMKGQNEEKIVKYQLIGSVNRIINQNNEEEFTYFCKRYINNQYVWISGIPNYNAIGLNALNIIQQTGKIIMLFYDKIK